MDLRYAWRGLWSSPGVTVSALAVLTLGIGTSTAIFSVVDAVALRGLPFAEARRLVSVAETHLPAGGRAMTVARQNFDRPSLAFFDPCDHVTSRRPDRVYDDGQSAHMKVACCLLDAILTRDSRSSNHPDDATLHGMTQRATVVATDHLESFVPPETWPLSDHQTDLPRIARDPRLTAAIARQLREIPTTHQLYCRDARDLSFLADESVHLVVTSPPYWTLKEYRNTAAQLGHVEDYEQFLIELDKVWHHCYRVLVPGGRLIVVVGDVCLSRRRNGGRHTVIPLHASIQEHSRQLGFDNLAPIIWHKIANAAYEVDGGGGFLGKPYEPNSVIKNDIEFVLMQRKPGGYRSPSLAARVLSVIAADDHRTWFQQIWAGLTGASTRDHPAPFPVELAERLIRMFSFVGDTVLDPFGGTGTTTLAASRVARNSVSVEVDPEYFRYLCNRLANADALLSRAAFVENQQLA